MHPGGPDGSYGAFVVGATGDIPQSSTQQMRDPLCQKLAGFHLRREIHAPQKVSGARARQHFYSDSSPRLRCDMASSFAQFLAGLAGLCIRGCINRIRDSVKVLALPATNLGIERLHVDGDFERMSSTAED
jgi:hypothetical protein